jgi:hypothetical protein
MFVVDDVAAIAVCSRSRVGNRRRPPSLPPPGGQPLFGLALKPPGRSPSADLRRFEIVAAFADRSDLRPWRPL